MSDRRFHIAARTFLFLLATLALAAPAAAGRALQCSTPDVETQYGEVCGLAINQGGQTVSHYLGIRYAAPPIGSLRWRAPQAPSPWSDTLQATAFGSACMQESGNFENPVPIGSEDCLFLNVYQPAGASGRPVMVYIHGGAFVEGSASTELFDGAALAANGNIVVVDFNYRLGALGFAVYGSGSTALIGNYGFLDQQFALNWVKNNIANFGGDPSQVTIAGQSAGAMSVGLHMVSAPASKGLFRAGILESNPFATQYQTPDQAQQTQMSQVIDNAPICQGKANEAATIRCLYAASPSDLVNAQSNTATTPGSLPWAPVIDGRILQNQPLQAFANLESPALFGTNGQEGTFFTYLLSLGPIPKENGLVTYQGVLTGMFDPTVASQVAARYPCINALDCRPQLADVITDFKFTCANRHAGFLVQNGTRVFGYQFNAVSGFDWPATPLCPPNDTFCPCSGVACHSAELPYVFGSAGAIDACGPQHSSSCQFNQGQQQLSTAMMGYWTSFVVNQVPTGTVAWPWYPTYLDLDVDPSGNAAQITQSDADPFNTECCFWENLGVYGEAPGCVSPLKGKKGAKSR